MKKKRYLPFLSFVFCTIGCSSPVLSTDEYIEVGIEQGEGFTVVEPFQEIRRGADAVFTIRLEEDYAVTGCSYWKSKIQPIATGCKITLSEVRYPLIATLRLTSNTVIIEDRSDESSLSSSIVSSTESSQKSTAESLSISEESTSIHDSSIFSSAESSSGEETIIIKAPKDGPHLRGHAPNGLLYFHHDGYLQVGWNTKKDGSGEFIGFGWRYDKDIENLYGVFEPETPSERFTFEEYGRGYRLTSYEGDDEKIVLPTTYNSKKITTIGQGAIHSETVKELILSPYITQIEESGIVCPNLSRLTFYDRLSRVSDSSLYCPKLQTVRLNAVELPCYSGTYWDAFQDKIDYLAQVQDKKKIILFSGSSARYGYNSMIIHSYFPDYEVVNMGVFAYFGAVQQLEIITSYMKEGDILLHAPEFDAIPSQFCLSNAFDERFFYCLESGYGEISRIDLRRMSEFFTAYGKYQNNRSHAPQLSYDCFAYHYDDEDNYYEELTYNVCGDMIFYRPNTDFEGRISQPYLDYDLGALFVGDGSEVQALNAVYQDYQNRLGIRILFAFAPKNIHCLPEDNTGKREELENYLRENLSVPVIMSIEDSLFPTKYFYKIDNHLSTEGAELRSNMIVTSLMSFI